MGQGKHAPHCFATKLPLIILSSSVLPGRATLPGLSKSTKADTCPTSSPHVAVAVVDPALGSVGRTDGVWTDWRRARSLGSRVSTFPTHFRASCSRSLTQRSRLRSPPPQSPSPGVSTLYRYRGSHRQYAAQRQVMQLLGLCSVHIASISQNTATPTLFQQTSNASASKVLRRL